MNNVCLLLIAMVVVSCTKTKTTTNNYTLPPMQPAFAINGITDITFTNNFTTLGDMNLTVQYLDSAQENVTLSLSGLPDKVLTDTGWVHSGVPTYNTVLQLYDTGGAVPGTYPVTIIATTPSGKQKAYTFNLKIQATPTSIFGRYNTCYAYCDSTVTYTDSLYADATVPNKVWFANYAGSGHAIYWYAHRAGRAQA